MKTFIKGIIFILIAVVFTGCFETTPSADQQDQERQEQLQKEGQAQAGLPNITNFADKKQLKKIYEARDNEKLITYVYLQAGLTGKLLYVGKALGYGFPYATQYSSPQKMITYSWGGSYTHEMAPQSEPNGLFMPADARGTWVMMLDSASNSHPVYFEPDVVVSPFKLDLQ